MRYTRTALVNIIALFCSVITQMETKKNEAGKRRQSGSEQGHELFMTYDIQRVTRDFYTSTNDLVGRKLRQRNRVPRKETMQSTAR